MKSQIKRTLTILLTLCFLVSMTAAAVSAENGNLNFGLENGNYNGNDLNFKANGDHFSAKDNGNLGDSFSVNGNNGNENIGFEISSAHPPRNIDKRLLWALRHSFWIR